MKRNVLGSDITFSQVLEQIKAENAYFVDTETTGLSANDKIIEISIYKIDQELVYHSVVNPKIPCSKQAESIHGITEYEIKDGKLINDCQDEINRLLKGKVIICFNADFDCKMLYQTFGTAISEKFCVMKWCEKVLDYQRYPRLSSVCERLAISYDNQHRSNSDTIAMINVFNKLSGLLTHNKSLLRDFAEINLDKLERLEHGEYLYLSPNSNIFSFDQLIDKYGNDIVGIRSKTLKRILKKPAVRIINDKIKGNIKLKIESLKNNDIDNLLCMRDLQEITLKKLKLKNSTINKYLSLNVSVNTCSVEWFIAPAIGKYYLPSVLVAPSNHEDIIEVVFYENIDRSNVAFKISNPKGNVKKLIGLCFQGYSSIITIHILSNEYITIFAQQLLDFDGISVSAHWSVDGEKDWNGNY